MLDESNGEEMGVGSWQIGGIDGGCWMLDEGKAEKIGDGVSIRGRETPMEGRMPFCARVIRLLPAAATGESEMRRSADG
jgi:hypothetical protein